MRQALVILAVLVLVLLAAGCGPMDYTNADNVDIQSFEPSGQSKTRIILQDTRVVRNCNDGDATTSGGGTTAGGATPIHETLEAGVADEAGVEWTVENEQGIGYIVRALTMPVAVDLTKPLGSTILMQVKSATAMRETRDLCRSKPGGRLPLSGERNLAAGSCRSDV